MTALVSYSTGTVSVAAGGTIVTGVGAIWSGTNARPGDILQIGNFQSVISDVTDVTHLVIPPWGGGAQAGKSRRSDLPARRRCRPSTSSSPRSTRPDSLSSSMSA
ncbi:hypothetical protein ABIF68_007299 [Bradyrhizobium japonicum]|jgi:hypothetical protein|uniref:hypothetical protein n=1 Tax=Bradyrhizobium japonicum TaxID=375 RepID=UPI0012FE78A8|nr:hypothetical protein [Bradyrhizobium japonicum]